ncbi:MAG TPA: nucleoside triphosphate pyrophosphohydrolase [Candidatus Acidoferrales bacterium]|jgi:MazG family protein|nr:nucleoside triphosphate pyrophosphohydrolase [Candidatus Acidoferrales bacterium]
MPKRKQSSKPKRWKPKQRGRVPNRAQISISPRDRVSGKWFEKLVALQARLRGPNGCPWDREQTHESLRKFLIEETYEVLDAMESGDPRKFSGELGDLLLQVVFHSILAEESGGFTMSDVIESVHTKMVRRHPHVFGSAKAGTSAAVLKDWEQIKAEERAAEGKASQNAIVALDSILGGVPRSLPAVLEAYQLTRRASHVGFDWENLSGIFDKLDEEKREIAATLRSATPAQSKTKAPTPHLEEEVGDLLFVGVNIARFLGVDPEIALRSANRKFKQRFQSMESAAVREGKRFADLPRERMEELWNQAKAKG